jgi:hypothetical protein
MTSSFGTWPSKVISYDLSFIQSSTYILTLAVPGVDALNEIFKFHAEIIVANQNGSATASAELPTINAL